MQSKLWVNFQSFSPIQVDTNGCDDIFDFIKACKKELSPDFDSVAIDRLSLSLTDGGPPLKPDEGLPGSNSAENPLFIIVAESAWKPPTGKIKYL
jgi:hypothetical protein